MVDACPPLAGLIADGLWKKKGKVQPLALSCQPPGKNMGGI